MSARAIVYQGSFGDSTLPRIGLTYTMPVAGALYDWDSDQLQVGGLSQWTSSVDGALMTADGGTPQVISSGIGKAVKLNGTTDRMRIAFSLATPHSVLAVFRFTAPAANQYIDFGYATLDAGRMGISTNGTTLNVTDGTSFLVPAPLITPDTGWHVALMTSAGASSVFRVDDFEVAGTLKSATRDGLTLGFAGGGLRTAIEYKRVAIIPGATTGWQRNALVAQMRQQYGI